MTENIDQILKENQTLKHANLSLETKVSNLETVIAERDAEINLLKEAMLLSRAKMFGSSSEKTAEGQLSLGFFDEAEKERRCRCHSDAALFGCSGITSAGFVWITRKLI